MKGDKFLVTNSAKAPAKLRGKVVIEQYRLKYCTCVKTCRGGYYKVANSCLRPKTKVRNKTGYIYNMLIDNNIGRTVTIIVPERNILQFYMFLNVGDDEIEVLSEPF